MSPEFPNTVEIPESWTRCEIHNFKGPVRGTIYSLLEAGMLSRIEGGVINIFPARELKMDLYRLRIELEEVKSFDPSAEILFF